MYALLMQSGYPQSGQVIYYIKCGKYISIDQNTTTLCSVCQWFIVSDQTKSSVVARVYIHTVCLPVYPTDMLQGGWSRKTVCVTLWCLKLAKLQVSRVYPKVPTMNTVGSVRLESVQTMNTICLILSHWCVLHHPMGQHNYDYDKVHGQLKQTAESTLPYSSC